VKASYARYLALLTLAAGAAVLFGPRPLAVVGGLLLALVLPGLAVTETVLRGRKLARVERVVLAPALSLAVLVISGLIVYVTGFTLDKIAWTSATVGVTLVGLFGATVPKTWAAIAARIGSYLIAEDDEDDEAPKKAIPAASPARMPATVTVAAPGQPVGAETVQIRPQGRDDTLILPAVVLEEQAKAKVAKQAENPDKAAPVAPKPPRRLVWQAAPLLLVVAILGGASWMAYHSSKSSYDSTVVTALSAAPSGPVNSAGTRAVAVTASGLVAADGPYTLVATGTSAKTTLRRTITVPANGSWTQSLTLPGSQRITINLYRSGNSSAYRTLFISAVE
jgi:hypothetical protein